MISGIDSLSSNVVALLFGSSRTELSAVPYPSRANTTDTATGYTDDVFRAGNAIGKIIEIVAGMDASHAQNSVGMFTMAGAVRTEGHDGTYSLTKTGTGTSMSAEQMRELALETALKRAAGTGPSAERARAFLEAHSNGTIKEVYLSAYGVSSTMTQTNYYFADGSDKGESARYTVTGLDEFLANNTYAGEDGTMRDKATGKYASINMNGTVYSYMTF